MITETLTESPAGRSPATATLTCAIAAALYCSIFIPVAVPIGYKPASIAVLIANVALGLVFPWAGAVAATACACGEVSMERMIRIRRRRTGAFTGIVATIHLVMAGLL